MIKTRDRLNMATHMPETNAAQRGICTIQRYMGETKDLEFF